MAVGIVQAIIDRQQWVDPLADAIQPLVSNLFGSLDKNHAVKNLLNGVWLGHPLHPMLTDVPVGVWTLAQLLDTVTTVWGDDEALDYASDIAVGSGIVVAVATALTGITDWSDTDGAQRRLGLVHGLLNTGGLTLYLGSMALRVANPHKRAMARTLSTAGYLTSTVAAYVAGELVYGIGQAVNRNAWVDSPDKFVDLAPADSLEEGKMQNFDLQDHQIVLLKDQDGVHAFGGTCSHFGCYLWEEGRLEGHTLTCQCHGSQFDISDGSLIRGPATAPIPSYDVRTRNGQIQVRLRQ